MIDPITVTSRLGLEQRGALEELLFFNVNQHRVRDGIRQSIETYGAPEIFDEQGWLRIRVGAVPEVQTLFALAGGRLLGVAVFVRMAHERFVVLHLGVAADAGAPVLKRLMNEIRGTARRTRGVSRIELVYKERHVLRLGLS